MRNLMDIENRAGGLDHRQQGLAERNARRPRLLGRGGSREDGELAIRRCDGGDIGIVPFATESVDANCHRAGPSLRHGVNRRMLRRQFVSGLHRVLEVEDDEIGA